MKKMSEIKISANFQIIMILSMLITGLPVLADFDIATGSSPQAVIVHQDFISTAAAPHAPPAPVSHWRLDESSGTTAYNAVSGAPSATLAGGLNFADGNDNSGPFHDGTLKINTDGYFINAGDPVDESLDFEDDNFSISCWFNFSSYPAEDQYLIKKGASSSNEAGYSLRIGENATITVTITVDDSGTKTTKTLVANLGFYPKNTWHNVVAVFDRENREICLYFNGNPVASSPSSDLLPVTGSVSSDQSFMIGAGGSPSTPTDRFKGLMDDIRVFNIALDDSQAYAVYKTPDNLYIGDYACAWLQDYIYRMTGATLPIYSESHAFLDNYTGNIISVGHTQLAQGANIQLSEDESRILVQTVGGSNVLFIIGDDEYISLFADPERDCLEPAVPDPDFEYLLPGELSGWKTGNKGSCKAVTMLLEELGVEWIVPSVPVEAGNIIPQRSTLSVSETMSKSYVPVFNFIKHESYNSQSFGEDEPFRYAKGLYESVLLKSHYGHTWPKWVNPCFESAPGSGTTLYEAHPEFFIKDVNDNVESLLVVDNGHLDTSNSAVKQFIINKMQDIFDAGFEVCELGQTDGWRPCFCSACEAVDPNFTWLGETDDPDAYYDDLINYPCERLHLFHEDIIKELAISHPNKKVLLLAYSATWTPSLKVGNNTGNYGNTAIAQICRRPYAYTMDIWDGKTGSQSIYAYYWGVSKSSGFLPKSSPQMLKRDFVNFRTNGVVGVQFNGYNDDWPLEGPVYYIASKLIQSSNPSSLNVDDNSQPDCLLKDYCTYIFGTEAADAMCDFYNKIYERVDATEDQAIIVENKNPKWFFTHTFRPEDISGSTGLDTLLANAEALLNAAPPSDEKIRHQNYMSMVRLFYDFLKCHVDMYEKQTIYENAPTPNAELVALNELEAAVTAWQAKRTELLAVCNDSDPTFRQTYLPGSGYVSMFLNDTTSKFYVSDPLNYDFDSLRTGINYILSQWKLDGSTVDSEGRHDGTEFAGWSNYDFDGIVGWAADLDGVDDYISVSHAETMNFGERAFSVSFRFKYASLPTIQQELVSKGINGTNGFTFALASTGQLKLSVKINSVVTNFMSVSAPSIDEWHHVVATFEPTGDTRTVRLYMDKVLVKSRTTLSPDSIDNTEPLLIGAQNASPVRYFFDGLIDDVRIYDKNLNVTEIDGIYDGYQPPTSRWTFDGNANDSIGLNNGTGYGDASFDVISDARKGYALDLDGAGDYVSVPDDDSLDFGTDSFTFVCRFKVDELNGVAQTLMFKGSSTDFFSIALTTLNTIRMAVKLDGVTKLVTSTEVPTTGEWHTLVNVVDRSTAQMHLYWNGVLVGSRNFYNMTRAMDSNEPLLIGSPSYFKGQIDDVRIYRRAFTAEEAAALLNFPGE